MMFDRPDDFLAHVGAEDLGGEAVVVLRGEPVADVVEEGAHHPVDVGTFAIGAGGGLQAVVKAADLVAGRVSSSWRRSSRMTRSAVPLTWSSSSGLRNRYSSLVPSFMAVNSTLFMARFPVKDVKSGSDDKRSARPGPQVWPVAPDDEAEERRPDQRGIGEGRTTEAGAARKARMRNRWPSPPATPLAISSSQSKAVGQARTTAR